MKIGSEKPGTHGTVGQVNINPVTMPMPKFKGTATNTPPPSKDEEEQKEGD